jgi:hypothetical protein
VQVAEEVLPAICQYSGGLFLHTLPPNVTAAGSGGDVQCWQALIECRTDFGKMRSSSDLSDEL